MNIKETEQFRQQLLNLRSEVRALELELKEAGETVVLDQTSVGRLSRMDAMQTQQMALESSRRRERRLISVDQALKRLEKQIYGICVDCDEDINVRRLEIDPTALRCIKCAEALSK